MPVYFVVNRKEQAVKIGKAIDPRKRLESLQIGNHNRLAMGCVLPGGHDEEAAFHEVLARYRIGGEWFRLSHESVWSIRNACETVYWKYRSFDECRWSPVLDRVGRLKAEFARFCRVEPKLLGLAANAAASGLHDHLPGPYCANADWFDPTFGLKRKMSRIIGWERLEKDSLSDSDAFEVAYDVLYQLHPDCRSCACIALVGQAASPATRRVAP